MFCITVCSPARFFRGVGSDSFAACFAGSDADDFVQLHDEDLAVTDLSGAGDIDDCFDDLLGNVVDDPGNFAVHADSNIRSLDHLATHAKARPGQLTVGTTGVGSDDHLAMLYFERIAGVKMNHVPFKGAADVRAAAQGKQIDVAAVNIGESMQAIKGGAPFRNLGQMSARRTELAADVPTFKEQGYNIEMSSLRGIAAPKGLPADVRERLVKAVAQTTSDPEFLKVAAGLFTQMRYLNPDQYRTVLRDTEAGFRKLWTEMPWGEK